MSDTKGLAADRTFDAEEEKQQAAAFGMVMFVVPVTFIALVVLLCVVRI